MWSVTGGADALMAARYARGVTRTGKTLASFAAAILLMAGCGNPEENAIEAGPVELEDLPAETSIEVPEDAATATGDGDATCAEGTTIAYVGGLTGAKARPSIYAYRGAKLAVDQHNEANRNCQVDLKRFDTEGEPGKATDVVKQVVEDESVLAVIGPATAEEAAATGQLFEDGGLGHITPSATDPDLAERRWTTFHRAVANDEVQAPAAALLAKNLGAQKVYVVRENTDYGRSLGTITTESLGAMLAGRSKVKAGTRDFSSVIAKVVKSKADVVYFVGELADAAALDRQLVARKFTGAFIGPDRVKDSQFIKRAGRAAGNAYFTCTCLPGELIPGFAREYKSAYKGTSPGTYAIEGYDSAILLLQGVGQGNDNREDMLSFIEQYSGQGYSKWMKWGADGEPADTPVYGYKVEDGKIVSVGPLD